MVLVRSHYGDPGADRSRIDNRATHHNTMTDNQHTYHRQRSKSGSNTLLTPRRARIELIAWALYGGALITVLIVIWAQFTGPERRANHRLSKLETESLKLDAPVGWKRVSQKSSKGISELDREYSVSTTADFESSKVITTESLLSAWEPIFVANGWKLLNECHEHVPFANDDGTFSSYTFGRGFMFASIANRADKPTTMDLSITYEETAIGCAYLQGRNLPRD
jgi:hypothetical protein